MPTPSKLAHTSIEPQVATQVEEHRWLAQLYAGAQRQRPGHGRRFLLAKTVRRLNADAAFWGLAGRSDGRPLGVETIGGLSARGLPLERFGHLNPVADRLESGGVAVVSLSGGHAATGASSALRRSGYGQAMVVLVQGSRTKPASLFVWYREDSTPNFSASDCINAVVVAEHASSAAAVAWNHFIARRPVHSTASALNLGEAVTSREGHLYQFTPTFADILSGDNDTVFAIEDRIPTTWKSGFNLDSRLSAIVQIRELGCLQHVQIEHAPWVEKLSRREVEVAHRVRRGESSKQVARDLGLSPATVSNHLTRIYSKLGIPGRSALLNLKKPRDFPAT